MQPKSFKQKLKNKNKNAKGEAFGPWIVSYADTVTLLLCFFIIFYAEEKKRSENEIILEITESIERDNRVEERQVKATIESISSKVRSGFTDAELEKLEFAKEKKDQEVVIRLYEKDFFEVGDFNLKKDGRILIDKIAGVLKPYQDKILIRVEGHTDSLKVSKSAFYKTNLNLSSLRASEAAQIFLDKEVDESRLRVLGFGSSRPLANDRTPSSQGFKYIPENAKKNRRVELRIQADKLDLSKVIKAESGKSL